MNKSKIFAKVAEIEEKRNEKVELSKSEVELASARSLSKAAGVAEGYKKAISKDVSDFLKAKRKLEGTLGNSENAITELKSEIKEFRSAAKELGFNPNSVEAWGDALQKLEDLEKQSADFKKLIK